MDLDSLREFFTHESTEFEEQMEKVLYDATQSLFVAKLIVGVLLCAIILDILRNVLPRPKNLKITYHLVLQLLSRVFVLIICSYVLNLNVVHGVVCNGVVIMGAKHIIVNQPEMQIIENPNYGRGTMLWDCAP